MRSISSCSVIFLFFVLVQAQVDYYQILGIEKDATRVEIKKAFRRLSLKLHPDKNPGDESASKKFAEVANAYGVLSDEDKKRTYDLYGEEGLNDRHRGGGDDDGDDPFDVFSEFFGGGGGRRRGRKREPTRGPDIVIPLRVSLADLYNGRILSFSIRRQEICPKCRGSGAKNKHDVQTCPDCNGRGVKITTRRVGPGFIQQFQQTCDRCHGTGKIRTSTCEVCGGHKVVMGDFEFDVTVERGMPDGKEIEYENYADEHPDHTAGHVRFIITTLPHPEFTRDGDDLWMDMDITLRESLIGFTKTFKHLDGRDVTVSRSKVTKPRQVITMKGQGMPHHEAASDKGKLKIKFRVLFPDVLTPEQKDGFQELFREIQ